MRFAWKLALISVPALVVFFGLSISLRNFRVDGPSMEATLMDGQRVVVNKLAYKGVFLFNANPPAGETLSCSDLPPQNWSSYKLVKWSW